MTKLGEAYKCAVCGNTVEVINPGAGEMVCCGQPMVQNQPEVKDEITLPVEPEKEEPPKEEPVI